MKKNKKYMTIVLSYDDSKNENTIGITKCVEYIIGGINNYNANYPLSNSNGTKRYADWPIFNIYGVYIDEDDMSIEKQNEINNTIN